MRVSGEAPWKKAQQAPWFWDGNRLCKGAVVCSRFSGGWAGVRFKPSPLREEGRPEAHSSRWRARRARREGGAGVLHLSPVPRHTVPWLLDGRKCLHRQTDMRKGSPHSQHQAKASVVGVCTAVVRGNAGRANRGRMQRSLLNVPRL